MITGAVLFVWVVCVHESAMCCCVFLILLLFYFFFFLASFAAAAAAAAEAKAQAEKEAAERKEKEEKMKAANEAIGAPESVGEEAEEDDAVGEMAAPSAKKTRKNRAKSVAVFDEPMPAGAPATESSYVILLSFVVHRMSSCEELYEWHCFCCV